VTERLRYRILARLGLQPTVSDTVRDRLDTAVAAIESRATVPGGGPALDALDAGCGRKSALGQYRARIRRLVGADVHRPPEGALPNLDDFLEVDLCGESSAIADGSFDVVLSSFTVEHFADPATAFRNLRRWLRPDGRIVLTTVNRRHPAVALYLGLPERIQRPMQRALKASAADAHPLVGICNDPTTLRSALEGAGFEDVRVVSVPNLARAWGRHLPFFLLGLIADLAAQPFSSRRSTLVADARVPSNSGVAVARAS
jgi:SAM-dependent methyltransferase